MARPKKQDSDKHDSRLYIRCRGEQKARIQARAKKLELDTSSYVLQMSLNGEVVVNDNTISFFELAVIHQLQHVGRWLNKSFTHRANASGDLPNQLVSCLRELDRVLEYVILSLNFHEEYASSLKEEDKKRDRERSYPVAMHPKLAFQLYGIDNNLSQLRNIAELRKIRPYELYTCTEKIEALLERIV